MKRTVALAILGLALAAGSASANGGWNPYIPPGHVSGNAGATLAWGPGGGGGGGGGGYGGGGYGAQGGGGGGPTYYQPFQLGPWYQYWPYEAHFQQPALPQYPYWGAQGLPGGLPYVQPGMPGQGAAPPYWGSGY